jgi:hypothetical protein
VKLLRRLLACLVVVLVLASMVFLAALIPAVQTWAAQAALAARPGLHATVGTLWVGFGFVDVTDLRLEPGGAVLKVPSLEARLPFYAAATGRRLYIRSLVAKGWTLDLSHLPAAGDPAAPGAPGPPGAAAAAPLYQAQAEAAQKAIRALVAALHAWRLPCDVTLDGIELEGDVILAPSPDGSPVSAHLAIAGGGVAPGHMGDFQVSAEVHNTQLPVSPLSVQGDLFLTMDTPRTLSRIGIKTDLTSDASMRHGESALSVAFAASRGATGDAVSVDLARGDRAVANLVIRIGAGAPQYAGTWKVDLRDSEIAPLAPDQSLPSLAISGTGDFDADDAFGRIRAAGHLNVAAAHLGALEPRLDRLGAVTLDGSFEAIRSGDTIRVARLAASVAGSGPVAVVRILQPFELDARSRSVRPADPKGDWIDVSIRDLPLAWLPFLADRLTLTGGSATGEFLLRAADGGIALRAKAPLAAANVSVLGAGRVLGQGLDLTLPLAADWNPKGWRWQLSPAVVTHAGHPVATIDIQGSRAASGDQPVAVTAKWSADLDALSATLASSAPPWMAGHSTTGEVTAKVASSTELDGKISVEGHDPGHSVAISGHADLEDDGGVSFEGPVTITTGPNSSQVAVKATWNGDMLGGGIDLSLSSDSVDLDHLRLLAAPLSTLAGVRLPGAPEAPGGAAKDATPFWGNWNGHIDASFGKLTAGTAEFNGAGGALYIKSGSIRLVGGHWMLPHTNMAKLDGTLTFDPRSASPYTLTGAANLNEVDVAPLFPGSGPDKVPGLEGRFSVAGTVAGSGASLGELIANTREEFHLSSTNGILRLLATSVADSIPEASTPVTDTLNSVGSAVGAFLGKRGELENGKNPVSKTADAVISFTYEITEIGYDRIAITAVRSPDGSIRLAQFELTAPDEHLVGSGEIAAAPGRPLLSRPLGADLKFAFRGHAAELLAKAGALSASKDALGYALLGESIHLGGSVGHIDTSAWHDFLARAATRKQDGKK